MGVAVALLGAAATVGWYDTRVSAADAPASTAVARRLGGEVDSYAAVVDRVSPSVVTIRAERRTRAPQQFPFANDPFFRRFFGDRDDLPQMPQIPEQRQHGLGSGVVVRADGHIVTNHHVIDGAEEITVELSDRRSFPATLVGSDPPSDLAVLKIDATGLPILSLADSEIADVGDIVLALGNPLGVGQTVTMGIISAKGRATGLGDGSFEDFLQTDAPINSGNSGGALVNTRGELLGINSQIVSPSGGNIGIGFAIPATMAKSVMEQLIDEGVVRRGRLGVTVQTIDSDLASSLELDDVQGAIVSDVVAGSAADRAGLRRGDVVRSLNGQPIADSNALRNRIASSQPGSFVTIGIVRDGDDRSLTATLDELERTADSRPNRGGQPSAEGPFGLTVAPLTADAARELGVDAESGLVVREVAPDSAAANAGLQVDDIIEQADHKVVTTASELRAVIEASPERPALLLVHRKDETLFLTVKNS